MRILLQLHQSVEPNEARRQRRRCSPNGPHSSRPKMIRTVTPIWREIYTMMRCPGAPCGLGPHCWRDPYGKKHYKLRTPHLKALIEYVKQGNVIKSHEDVPAHIQEQLLAEERQRLDRQPKSTSSTPTPYPPITITNVMPQSYQSPSANSTEATPPATVLPAAVPLSANANRPTRSGCQGLQRVAAIECY